MANTENTDIWFKGYSMCEKKKGNDPISGYLDGTEEHRMFMKGWNEYLEHIQEGKELK